MLLFKGFDHFNIRKIKSKFSQRCLFHPSPSCLCFPALPPFFFKDSDFLIKYPFIDVKSLHSFPSMLLSGDSQEDTNGATSLLFFVSLLLWWFNFKFRCWSYLFLLFHISSHVNFLSKVLLFIHLAQFISGVWKISWKIHVSILNLFKLFWVCYLIQAI